MSAPNAASDSISRCCNSSNYIRDVIVSDIIQIVYVMKCGTSRLVSTEAIFNEGEACLDTISRPIETEKYHVRYNSGNYSILEKPSVNQPVQWAKTRAICSLRLVKQINLSAL